MKQFVIRRIGYCVLSLFLLSLTIFFFVRVTGDPATLLVEPGASPADIAAIHHQFGLDRPLIVQYALFMASVLGPVGGTPAGICLHNKQSFALRLHLGGGLRHRCRS